MRVLLRARISRLEEGFCDEHANAPPGKGRRGCTLGGMKYVIGFVVVPLLAGVLSA